MTTTFYDHWRDAPESDWRWPNFSPPEIACRGTGKLLINEPALDKLQALRDRLGKPLIVRSAYRIIDELDRNAQPPGCHSVRVSLFYKRDGAFP